MACFRALPALNLTAFDALIFMVSPVLGFLPFLALRLTFENVPKPIRVIFPFFFFNALIMLPELVDWSSG